MDFVYTGHGLFHGGGFYWKLNSRDGGEKPVKKLTELSRNDRTLGVLQSRALRRRRIWP